MEESKKGPEQEAKVKADLSGIWYNELGSEMSLSLSSDGKIEGKYQNHAPHSAAVSENVIGSVGNGIPATLGFIVNFEGGKYTTAWSGQYYNDKSSKDGEVLLTTWIMTANVPDAKEYWEATCVGQDRFTRRPQERKGRKSLKK